MALVLDTLEILKRLMKSSDEKLKLWITSLRSETKSLFNTNDLDPTEMDNNCLSLFEPKVKVFP